MEDPEKLIERFNPKFSRRLMRKRLSELVKQLEKALMLAIW